jgi:hypothetical protein
MPSYLLVLRKDSLQVFGQEGSLHTPRAAPLSCFRRCLCWAARSERAGAVARAMPTEADYENLRLFSSYSPAEVVLRYAYSSGGKPQPPTKPEHKDFDSAIGFVDVSGFTALSEKLNQEHGRKGAELLNQ